MEGGGEGRREEPSRAAVATHPVGADGAGGNGSFP